jgi:streptogrisin C
MYVEKTSGGMDMYTRALLGVVVLLGSTALAGDIRAVTETADARLAIELKFRQDFGLDADPAAVRALMGNPAAYDGNFPVALSPPERAEMGRRIAMEAKMAPLELHAQGLPGFAGIWIDQPSGGVIKVALVGGTDGDRATLQRLVPPGARLEIVPARHTFPDLQALQRRIRDRADEFQTQGHRIGLLYVHLQSNSVRIGVTSESEAALNAMRAQYGDAVSIEIADPVPTACTDRWHCQGPPLRAGIAAPTNAAVPCSLAFLIRKFGTVGWLTAGHCAPNVGAVWFHDGIGIGTIRATCWPQCNFSDAARAGELNSTFSGNRVYVSGNATGRHVTGSQGRFDDNYGNYTCLNARRAEAWRCGYIQSDNAFVCYQRAANGSCTIWFTEMRLASFANAYGDSGGAVHSSFTGRGVVAYGVESGCTSMPNGDTCSGLGIYSHIANVLTELGNWSVCSALTPCE